MSVLKELVNHTRSDDTTDGYISVDEDTRRDYLIKIQNHLLSHAGARDAVTVLDVVNG